MNKSISFIIPAYNCQSTIEETVNSILAGNCTDGDEIVIVDDGSADATLDLLKKLEDDNACIRIIVHSRNKGGGAARNTAVESARNELIFCLDSDNLLLPGSVGALRDFLLFEGMDVAAFRELHYFSETPNRPTHMWRFKSGLTSLADYLAGSVVPGASGNYLYTRASWEQAGGYPDFAGALDAWGFGLRQVATGQRMATMPTGHYCHRYGHESYWVRESRAGKTSLTGLQILIPFLDQLTSESCDYMMSKKYRNIWFERLNVRPLMVVNQVRGRPGDNLSMTGEILNNTDPGILARMVRKIEAFF